MLPITKPSLCQGCPFYTKGKYFTPDSINSNSEVMFIAQNPGSDEETGHKLIKRTWHGYGEHSDEFTQVQPQPLIGATGQLFNGRFLPLSGLKRSEVSLGNAIRCRPGTALGLQPDQLPTLTNKMKLETSKADIVGALRHCATAYLKIPTSVKVIVAMGGYSWYQLTGISNITDWRGYALETPSESLYTPRTLDSSYYHSLRKPEQRVVFGTLHIAALFKGENKKFFHASLNDFHKLKLLLVKQWPKPLPQFSTGSPLMWPSYSSFDTEYSEEERYGASDLHRWSLCDVNMHTYVVEGYDTSPFKLEVNSPSTVIIQNAITSDDIPHLSKIISLEKINIEDMMLAHSVLWTGERHSLNYINSLYGAFNRYKHLSQDEPRLYSALDAYEPMYMWKSHFIPEFKSDPLSWKIYKKLRLPLIKIIHKAQNTGAKVDTSRLEEVQILLKDHLEELKAQARAITGDENFNLGGSKQVKEVIYG